MSVLEAKNLRKTYKDTRALDGLSLHIEPGQIVGLIGPNGSGKTTAINAILGLNTLDEGDLRVMGKDPSRQRAALMRDIAYIADTGILPKWMKVKDLLDYVQAVHPRFSREVAEQHLGRTDILRHSLVRALSKGMHVQLHLAIVLAIDAPFLVLDEPTLGLDILYRQQFYDAILNDYFNETRSILVTTHEVREIEHILTDVVLINKGRDMMTLNMSAVGDTYLKLTTHADANLPAQPLYTRKALSGTEHIFSNVARTQLQELGEVSTPNLAELFVAVVEK